MGPEYKYKEYFKYSKSYKFTITGDGHTMMPFDIVLRLNENSELKEEIRQKDELILKLKRKGY